MVSRRLPISAGSSRCPRKARPIATPAWGNQRQPHIISVGSRHFSQDAAQIHSAVLPEDADQEIGDSNNPGCFQRSKIKAHAGNNEKHGKHRRRKTIHLTEQLLILGKINIGSAENHTGKRGDSPKAEHSPDIPVSMGDGQNQTVILAPGGRQQPGKQIAAKETYSSAPHYKQQEEEHPLSGYGRCFRH